MKFLKMVVLLGALLPLLALVSFQAAADGIQVEPGNWKMTSTVSIPMLPQPRVTTEVQCLQEKEFTPELMADDPDSSCVFDAVTTEDNTMSWSVDCTTGGSVSHGEWEVTSFGNTLSGDGTITVSMQEQEMVMTMAWEGERIGACDQ